MFKKLKSQVQEAVAGGLNQLNQLNASPTSNNQHANNSDVASTSGRSRVNSYSSVTSDTTTSIFGNYSTPQRKYYPPSDIESEFEVDSFSEPNTSGASSPTNNEIKKLNKLLDIYKNKFNQLKNAYTEVETEKEKIKRVLAESQDKVLKRVQELKDQIEADKQAKKELESQLKLQLTEKENLISSLKTQLNSNSSKDQKVNAPNLIDPEAKGQKEADSEGPDTKTKKLENVLSKCKELIKTQKEQLAEKEKQIKTQTAELDGQKQI
jgi:DNA repair exonuclease SbcCD ATPase subunit